MKLQTEVKDEKCKVGISYSDRIMFLGSCFSDNIGRIMSDYAFDVCVNPFGTLYNPASICSALERLATARGFTMEECVQMGSGSDKICSFSHHTSFARADAGEFLKNANESLAKAAEFFRSCNKIVITLGTAWCYRNIASGNIVSNCLKRNAKEFDRILLSLEECTGYLERILELCCKNGMFGEDFTPKEIIFTVSPIRHMADGAHGNQLSKSTLLLAIDTLVRSSHKSFNPAGYEEVPTTDYFPAYEIMMDQLRDYRFYAEDMVHPSAQAVNYILERFLDWALPKEERPVLENKIKAFKQSQHICK